MNFIGWKRPKSFTWFNIYPPVYGNIYMKTDKMRCKIM